MRVAIRLPVDAPRSVGLSTRAMVLDERTLHTRFLRPIRRNYKSGGAQGGGGYAIKAAVRSELVEIG